MDLLDIVEPLPTSNEVRRLVHFCINDLKIEPYMVASTLGRAHRVAEAVSILSGEAHREENDARHAEQMARMYARHDAMIRDLEALNRKLSS